MEGDSNHNDEPIQLEVNIGERQKKTMDGQLRLFNKILTETIDANILTKI